MNYPSKSRNIPKKHKELTYHLKTIVPQEQYFIDTCFLVRRISYPASVPSQNLQAWRHLKVALACRQTPARVVHQSAPHRHLPLLTSSVWIAFVYARLPRLEEGKASKWSFSWSYLQLISFTCFSGLVLRFTVFFVQARVFFRRLILALFYDRLKKKDYFYGYIGSTVAARHVARPGIGSDVLRDRSPREIEREGRKSEKERDSGPHLPFDEGCICVLSELFPPFICGSRSGWLDVTERGSKDWRLTICWRHNYRYLRESDGNDPGMYSRFWALRNIADVCSGCGLWCLSNEFWKLIILHESSYFN